MNNQELIRGIVVCVALHAGVCAVPYTGSGPGTSVINADGTGDYLSLGTAVAAVNATPLTGGDWTFLIASNIDEPAKVALGQETNGNHIIFKPAPGMQPLVRFPGFPPTPSTWPGEFIIGTPTTADFLSNIKTDNVIIDGSNNGTSSRDLTMSCNSEIVSVVADSDGFQIKNCNLVIGQSPAIGLGAINQGAFVNATPDNAVIQNCFISPFPSAAGRGSGISLFEARTSPATIGSANIVITGNDIEVGKEAITASRFRSVTITDNYIDVNGISSVSGIRLDGGSTSTEPIVVLIENNEITRVSTSASAGHTVRGISVFGSSSSTPPRPVVTIRNNSLAGVRPTGTLPGSTVHSVSGIRVNMSRADVEVINNSVNVMSPANYTITDPLSLSGGLSVSVISGATAVLQNNIIRYEAPVGYAIQRGGSGATWTQDSNAYYYGGGAEFGVNDGTVGATLSHWQDVWGLELNSVVQDPLAPGATGAGTWTSSTNLRFTAPPTINFAGTPVAGLTTDLQGNPRDPVQPYKGAFEGTGFLTAGVSGAFLYE